MSRKYKNQKKGTGRFVQIPEWLMASEAWATMKPAPRALYVELKRRFNGKNNGAIYLSHRDAAKALSIGRDTAGGYFAELVDRGFLIVTRGHCLGPEGKGQSATYALTEERLDGAPASKDFLSWKEQKPGRKSRHTVAGKSNVHCRETQHLPSQKSENSTGFGQNRALTVLENPAIYTSSHIPSEISVVPTWFNIVGLCGRATVARSRPIESGGV